MPTTITTLDHDMETGYLCQHCGGDFDWKDVHHDSYDFSTDKGVVCYCRDCYEDEIDPTCRECDGDGYTVRGKRGGSWNAYLGGWEPDEHEVRCVECNGSGRATR